MEAAPPALLSLGPRLSASQGRCSEEPALGLRDKLTQENVPPGGLTVPCASARPPRCRRAGSGARRPCSAARPLGPGPRAPGSRPGVPARVSARLSEPCPHSLTPAGCRPGRTVSSPQAPGSSPAGGQSLGTRTSGDLGTDRKRQQRGGSARARTRTQGEVRMRRRAPEVGLTGPNRGSGTNSRTLFPKSLQAVIMLGTVLIVSLPLPAVKRRCLF